MKHKQGGLLLVSPVCESGSGVFEVYSLEQTLNPKPHLLISSSGKRMICYRYFVCQDPPCTLNWGYMVPNSRYLGPNRG